MTQAIQTNTRHPYVPAGQGQKWRVITEIVEAKLTEEDTNGAYTVFEVRAPPGGGPALLHTHAPQETFYILEGTFEFGGLRSEGRYGIRASTGAVVHIPAGALHGFQNVGDAPGRVLVVYEPPGLMQSFFATMHAAVDHPDPLNAPVEALPDQARILEIFAQHQMEVFIPEA
jgi:quercetin dioxygenase-like cupin family protein